MRKKAQKNYVYERDGRTCHHCGKQLKYRQVTLDHYLPRSKGGPGDVFNLVLSCKSCNKLKLGRVFPDYKEVMMRLFKQGVTDGKIRGASLSISHNELLELVEDVYRVEDIGEHTVFQSSSYRFYVKRDLVQKMVYVDTQQGAQNHN